METSGSLRVDRNLRKRRYRFACVQCKARKIRCSGDQPVCRACQRSNVSCHWQEDQLQHATSRIHELETALQQAQERATPRLDGGRQSGATSPASSEHRTPSSHAPLTSSSLWFQVGLSDEGNVTYNGPTSRFHAGPLEDGQDATSPPGFSSATRATHIEALHAQYRLLETVWAPLMVSRPSLAGVDNATCTALLDVFWTWIQPLHNWVYKPCFLIDMALGGPHYSDFLLMCMLAHSARKVTERDMGIDGLLKGEHYLARAKELLLEEMSAPKPRIPTIQGLLILGGRQCAIGKSSEGWLYTGMAIRMLMDIGLHLYLENPRLAELENLTPVELEVRKRLYNSAYVWDKTISLALGRPPVLLSRPYSNSSILDDRDNLQMWMPVHAPEITERYNPTPFYNTLVFCAHSQLHEITTEMMLLFANGSNVNVSATETQAIGTKFTSWFANLPEEIKISDPSSMLQSPPPHVVSINLIYHALNILLHRPQLHSPNANIQGRSSKICTSHSKHIHDIFCLYSKTFPHRMMTYQVSYCIFTAATVEVDEMTRMDQPAATQAAQRLGTAIRALDDESKNTPSIGRSLDTIRRQLATRVSTTKPEAQPTLRSDGSSNELQPTLPPMTETNNTTDRSSFVDTVLGRDETAQGTPLFNPPSSALDEMSGFSRIDTNAGFHPDAFPWRLLDNPDQFWNL
ncbi:fungal-specific transcription factor domain-containing protein [Xylariaceae sp. FL1019]|nr:fungal-specific transcription factor domain-containing protein [Xylariaceae sp. FL1019]